LGKFFSTSILILFCLVFQNACMLRPSVQVNLSDDIIQQIDQIYDPSIEKGFCVSSSAIHNIQEGFIFGSQMPKCSKSDIVMHTHPLAPAPSIIDWDSWGIYKERHGNLLYGIYAGSGKYAIFER